MAVYAIIQARTGSSRLPGKVLMPIAGKAAIQRVIDRVSRCREINKLCIATTQLAEDDVLFDYCVSAGVCCFRGDAYDVLDRYYQAAITLSAGDGDYIMRVSGDCPLIDPAVCDDVIRLAAASGADYASNNIEETFPDGLDCEVFTFETLVRMQNDAKYLFEREHVTQHAKRNREKFNCVNLRAPEHLGKYRWTLDEPEDYEFLCAVYSGLDNEFADMYEVIRYLGLNPGFSKINSHLIRNEGLIKSLSAEGLV